MRQRWSPTADRRRLEAEFLICVFLSPDATLFRRLDFYGRVRLGEVLFHQESIAFLKLG